MPPSLTKQFAGLPRWAWLAILAGGITFGLILRQRNADSADEGDAEYADDSEVMTDAEMIGDPYYNVDGSYMDPTVDGGSGGFYYQGPLPSAISPNVTVNIGSGGKGNQSNKKCKKGKPSRKPPKGTHWACRNGLWTAVPNKHSGGKGGGGRSRAAALPTGGGPPDRVNQHKVPLTTQARIAEKVMQPSVKSVILASDTSRPANPAQSAPVVAVSTAPRGNVAVPSSSMGSPVSLPVYTRRGG